MEKIREGVELDHVLLLAVELEQRLGAIGRRFEAQIA
jgi:hypothetical protein